jgi:hypothetical protein
MFSFTHRSCRALVSFAMVFVLSLLTFESSTMSAADCSKIGCYDHYCFYVASQAFLVVNGGSGGATCYAFYSDPMGNQSTCGADYSTVQAYKALGTQECPPAGNTYGTVQDETKCTKMSDTNFGVSCCKNQSCKQQS